MRWGRIGVRGTRVEGKGNQGEGAMLVEWSDLRMENLVVYTGRS